MKTPPIVVLTIVIARARAGEQPLCRACNPQIDRKVVKAFADTLEAMQADGTYERITADNE